MVYDWTSKMQPNKVNHGKSVEKAPFGIKIIHIVKYEKLGRCDKSATLPEQRG